MQEPKKKNTLSRDDTEDSNKEITSDTVKIKITSIIY